MAIVAMKKLTLVALQSEREALLAHLAETQNIHLMQVQETNNTFRTTAIESKDDILSKLMRVQSCLEYVHTNIENKANQLKKQGQKPPKNQYSLNKRQDVDYADIVELSHKEAQLLAIADKAEEVKKQIEEIDRLIEIELNRVEQMRLYLNLDVPLSQIGDTAHTKMLLGVCTATKTQIETLAQEHNYAEWAVLDSHGDVCSLLVICHKQDYDKVSALLSPYSFALQEDKTAMRAMAISVTAKSNADALRRNKGLLIDSVCDLACYTPQLKILHDYYYIQKQLLDTDEKISRTQDTFIMQCWLPAEKQEEIEALLGRCLNAYVSQYDEPSEEEQVPTLLKNNSLVQPFESVTEMYSLPNYFEIDPNPLVAVFYWLFMGVIMGDVGYGLLMAVLAIVFVRFMKVRGGVKNLALVIGFSAVSTIIWGVLFGGWFAISEFPIKQVLISPLSQPLEMILLCILLGVVQLSAGIVMSMANKIKKGNVWGALLDDLPWVFFNIGLALAFINVFSSLLFWEGDYAPLLNIGLIVMAVSMGILVVLGGRNKKGFGKVVGGLGNIYNIINVFSDVLSYLRLFGLGLTTGVIGMVFNILAGMLLGNPFTFIFGVAVLIFGHGLNLAISLLGAYIHDARLQHIEFFGKFYTGEGFAFVPVASRTKYVNLTKNKEQSK